MRLSGGGTVCAAVLVAAALIVGVWPQDVSAIDTKNVIVVSIDGLRCYEAFHSTPACTLVRCMRDSLSEYGTLYTNLWNRGVTQTQGGHLTIGTGAWQLMPNGLSYFGPREDTISTQPDVPMFFEYYNKANGYSPDSNKTFYFGGKKWNDTLACSVDPEYGRSYGGMVVVWPLTDTLDTATYDSLITLLGNYHPHLVLVNFKDVDTYGHWADNPPHTKNHYYRAVVVADSLVWELWKWLQHEDNTFYRDKTTLIVTTDHGRHDDYHGDLYDHSGICHGCRHLFALIAGPSADIEQDTTIAQHVDQIDICPTVGELLEFHYPKARGRPLAGALKFTPSYMTGGNYGAGNDNVRVSNTDSISVSPYIARSSTVDTLHVVYVDKSTGKFEVMYKRSTNSGASWGDLDTLSATEIDAQCPSICAIGNTLYATWMDCRWHQQPVSGQQPCDSVPRWYLYYCKSTNAGGSWGSPTEILGSIYETAAPTPSQSIWDPVVNYDFGSVVGIAVRYGVVQGQNRVGCFRSTNGGSSWMASWLDDEAWFPLHCDLATESYGEYNWAFGTWYDLDTLRTSVSGNCWYIMFNRSSNAGATWPNLYELHKDSTYVADPTVDTDLPDVLISWALWVASTDKWQIYLQRSTDTGAGWLASPTVLSSASAGAIDPELIFATDNNFYDFWVDYDVSGDPVDSDIVYKYSTDGGQTWGSQSTLSVGQSYSLRPSVCRHKGVVWEDYRHGNWEIYFDSP